MLALEPYAEQVKRWPATGRQILAQFDDQSIVVYQAFQPFIGRFAAEHGHFAGGGFSLTRMSWIKPGFLWMMYRSRWGTKEGQEVVLAVRLKRAAFDEILQQAAASSFDPSSQQSPEAWKRALARSPVRLQWDPDHDPSGTRLPRRALQLGLSGEPLARYAREWIVGIEDLSPFVAEQRARASQKGWPGLVTPREEVYPTDLTGSGYPSPVPPSRGV